jgi:hypothetical protein
MPSEASIKQYESRIALLNKAGFTDFTEQAEEVIKYLDAMATFSNRKLYTSAILYSYNGAPPPAVYKDYIAKQFAAQNVKDERQQLTESQEKNFMPWKEILAVQKMLNQKPEKSRRDMLDLLVVSLYTLADPVRADYGDMRIAYTDNGRGNILLMGRRPVFLFREYKTSASYGEVRIPVSKALKKILELWFNKLGAIPDYLLAEEYSAAALSNLIRRVFHRHTGKYVGINLLRHARITAELANPKTIRQKRKLASAMLHSTQRQEKYAVMNGRSATERNDA